jgi:hypothetical protein
MKPAVEKLTMNDMIALAAYAASLEQKPWPCGQGFACGGVEKGPTKTTSPGTPKNIAQFN